MTGDHDKLREAIHQMRLWMPKHPAAVWAQTIHDAAASTVPKTKMVEVWHCEWWEASTGRARVEACQYKAEAEVFAYGLRAPIARCIRVTGPHQQEVPV